MITAGDSNQMIGGLAVGALIFIVFWRLIVWIRDSPVRPDPWDAEMEQKLSEPDAVEVCHHCFTEQPDNAWFCARCGCAVGPYNNAMSYLNIFSQGEILRNGLTEKFRLSPFIVVGYLIFSLASYTVFAPVYWFQFFKNIRRLKASSTTPDQSA